jgi:Na+/glutamate symporter
MRWVVIPEHWSDSAKKRKAMNTNNESRYDSFEAFVREIIEERSKQGKPIDHWIAAVAAILGPTTLSSIARALNISANSAAGSGAAASAGLRAALPVLGAVTGAVTGILLAKYLAKAHSRNGMAATRVLKKAESKYRDYSAAPLDVADRKELINDLFADLLAGREPQ